MMKRINKINTEELLGELEHHIEETRNEKEDTTSTFGEGYEAGIEYAMFLIERECDEKRRKGRMNETDWLKEDPDKVLDVLKRETKNIIDNNRSYEESWQLESHEYSKLYNPELSPSMEDINTIFGSWDNLMEDFMGNRYGMKVKGNTNANLSAFSDSTLLFALNKEFERIGLDIEDPKADKFYIDNMDPQLAPNTLTIRSRFKSWKGMIKKLKSLRKKVIIQEQLNGLQ